MTEKRRPVHLAVLLGTSAGMYALSLAGVTALQASADGALIDERAPLGSATSSLAGAHDSLETDLATIARVYGDAAARYDRLTPGLDGMESSLDALGSSVSQVSGAARALPGRVALPAVARSVSTSTAPVTHARTGASGG
jgi:hypothetical protein